MFQPHNLNKDFIADFTPCPPALIPDPCDRWSDNNLELRATSQSDSHISNFHASAFQENLFGNCPSLCLFFPLCHFWIFLFSDYRCCLNGMKRKRIGRTSAISGNCCQTKIWNQSIHDITKGTQEYHRLVTTPWVLNTEIILLFKFVSVEIRKVVVAKCELES